MADPVTPISKTFTGVGQSSDELVFRGEGPHDFMIIVEDGGGAYVGQISAEVREIDSANFVLLEDLPVNAEVVKLGTVYGSCAVRLTSSGWTSGAPIGRLTI